MSREAAPPERPWSRETDAVADALGVGVGEGLAPEDVRARRDRFGPNRLRRARRRSAWRILLEQFKSQVVWLLLAAAGAAFLFQEWVDGAAILVVVLINAAIGFATELRAVRSMEALREMGSVHTTVRRGGERRTVPAEDLVPGDVVVLEGGDVVTADQRLLEASKLQTNESALTGESTPVDKGVGAVARDAPLAERASMVYKGTSVTRGSGLGVIVSTGMDTELGRISSLVEEAEEEATPLETRLDQLAHRLLWLTLAIAAAVTVSGILRGREILLMIETGIALAVAAIPEGLPIVATIALARGMRRMARRNALVNRLSAVETLGGTNVIFTDKTGTLTENRMTAVRYALAAGDVAVGGRGMETEGGFEVDGEAVDPPDHAALRRALEIGVLCNNAALGGGEEEKDAVGDPVETALLVAGAKAGIRRADLLETYPETREEAFDPAVKMMATVHETDDGFRVAVKGAPEAVLECATRVLADGDKALDESRRDGWRQRNDEMAASGLRVLGLAEKRVGDASSAPYEDLSLVGLVGLLDPPRADVKEAIRSCHEAGVRVIMVTGDHAATARNVAHAVGLVEDEDAEVWTGRDLADGDGAPIADRLRDLSVLARVDPEQKLDLIHAFQQRGDTVAMTGDGVNDAPALKKADIGIAMGQRGTQVAREAADVVLKDDAFSTIVVAIQQGRTIFRNIRQFVVYLLSCNSSEILTVGLASLANAPLPIQPLQILFLNLVTDVFPALALGMGPGDPEAMRRPPRDPAEPIVTRRHWGVIGGYGLLITAVVLAALYVALTRFGMEDRQAVSISFLTLAFAQLWHVFNMRDTEAGPVKNDVTRNPYVWGALVLCVLLLLGATYIPVVADVLQIEPPDARGWLFVLGLSAVPLAVGQALAAVGFRGMRV